MASRDPVPPGSVHVQGDPGQDPSDPLLNKLLAQRSKKGFEARASVRYDANDLVKQIARSSSPSCRSPSPRRCSSLTRELFKKVRQPPTRARGSADQSLGTPSKPGGLAPPGRHQPHDGQRRRGGGRPDEKAVEAGASATPEHRRDRGEDEDRRRPRATRSQGHRLSVRRPRPKILGGGRSWSRI